jgi:hypothetical protein
MYGEREEKGSLWALHCRQHDLPEVEGLNPEDYPDINKLGILADIAPYSREYNRIRAVVDKQANGNPELRAHYEQIVDQVIPIGLPAGWSCVCQGTKICRTRYVV